MSKLTSAQISHAKSLGFLQNRGTDCLDVYKRQERIVLLSKQLAEFLPALVYWGYMILWNVAQLELL